LARVNLPEFRAARGENENGRISIGVRVMNANRQENRTNRAVHFSY
jgi:hypothetical protein